MQIFPKRKLSDDLAKDIETTRRNVLDNERDLEWRLGMRAVYQQRIARLETELALALEREQVKHPPAPPRPAANTSDDLDLVWP